MEAAIRTQSLPATTGVKNEILGILECGGMYSPCDGDTSAAGARPWLSWLTKPPSHAGERWSVSADGGPFPVAEDSYPVDKEDLEEVDDKNPVGRFEKNGGFLSAHFVSPRTPGVCVPNIYFPGRLM